MNKRDVTQLQILQFALEGVTASLNAHASDPNWTKEDWVFHYNAQKEIERRIRISNTRAATFERTKVPK